MANAPRRNDRMSGIAGIAAFLAPLGAALLRPFLGVELGHFDSLRTKFVRTMLLVTGIIGLATLAIVVFVSTKSSARELAAVQHYIEEGITSKGKVLTENQARALRSLTLDNAFVDMQALVDRAVNEDADLFYGLYLNTQGETLAYSRRGARPSTEGNTDPHAFRELGLRPDELLVEKSRVQRVRRLGQDLLEVAVPVVAEDGEIMGTIRYGLSTARMQAALVRAKQDARAELERSLWLVGSLLFGAVLLGSLLSRLQGTKITRPVADLTLAAQGLAAGDRAVRVKIESKDELEILGASFNRMVEDLDASYRTLEEMNRTLEHKVEARSAELAQKNRDMRLVLDNVDQGFATLSADGTMALERSRVVSQWFGDCKEPVPFWDYMSGVAPGFAGTFQLAWEQILEDILPLEASMSQLPTQLSADGRTFWLRYLPFLGGGKLEGMLVVIDDMTERLIKAREEAEQGELVEVFKGLMLDRSGMETFLREANSLVETVCSPGAELVLVKRSLHTLKGNAAAMGLVVVSGLCHELETELEEGAMSSSKVAELGVRWNAIRRHVSETASASVEKVIEAPVAEYTEVVARLSSDAHTPPGVLQQMLEWRRESAGRSLHRLAEQARGVARRLQKEALDVEVESNGVRLDPDRFGALFTDLVHIVRNAVDHGIEPPAEREAKGKPRAGTLSFSARYEGDDIVFEIADDGRGIDWTLIREGARARGLPSQTDADLLRALCYDGLTTRGSVTTTSGRGVGMAAVRQRVESMHGRLDVHSVKDRGTTWVLRFARSVTEHSPGRPRAGLGVRASSIPAEGRQ